MARLEPQHGPKAQTCFHQGKFEKSWNVQDSRGICHTKSRAGDPVRFEGPSMASKMTTLQTLIGKVVQRKPPCEDQRPTHVFPDIELIQTVPPYKC